MRFGGPWGFLDHLLSQSHSVAKLLLIIAVLCMSQPQIAVLDDAAQAVQSRIVVKLLLLLRFEPENPLLAERSNAVQETCQLVWKGYRIHILFGWA